MNIKSILVLTLSTFFLAQVASAEGLADRRAELWSSPVGVEHIHSIQTMQRGLIKGTGGLADRKAHQEDVAKVVDHIHDMHGHTAAGSKDAYKPHGHKAHRHTVKSGWSELPDGLTAHQKKRLMFDYNGPRH